MSDYNFEDRKFFYLKNGKQIAQLGNENEVVFEPGCCGPHTRMLSDWLTANGLQFANLPVQKNDEKLEVTESGMPEEVNRINTPTNDMEAEKKEETDKKIWTIHDIPYELLPPFDFMLGTDTPGFWEYVKQHKLNKTQTVALIKRLEGRK